MTVAEFFAWTPPFAYLWQLVDGEPQQMAMANLTHGSLQGEIGAAIRDRLAQRASPCSVITAPGIVPHVVAETNIRVPDLAVTCTGYDAEESALTDPVLVVRSVAEQSGRNLGQCLGLRLDPERSRNPRPQDRHDRRRAAAPRRGRRMARPTRCDRGRRPEARGRRLHLSLRRRLSDDAAGAEEGVSPRRIRTISPREHVGQDKQDAGADDGQSAAELGQPERHHCLGLSSVDATTFALSMRLVLATCGRAGNRREYPRGTRKLRALRHASLRVIALPMRIDGD